MSIPSLRERVAKAIRDVEDPDEYVSEFYAHADAAIRAVAEHEAETDIEAAKEAIAEMEAQRP
jgi:DNA-binding MurR/RpiR family transcriptional regulator